MTEIKELIGTLSTDSLDFGKSPKSALDQAIPLVRDSSRIFGR